MGRPAKDKSIAHPLLQAIAETQGRVDVLERRLDQARQDRDQTVRAALAGGLLQADCARAMGISRTHISRLVKERRLAPGALEAQVPARNGWSSR